MIHIALIVTIVNTILITVLTYRVLLQRNNIGKLEKRVEEQQKGYEELYKWTDTLFNDEDMRRIADAAYIAGMRRDETWDAEKWIAETFSDPTPAEYPHTGEKDNY